MKINISIDITPEELRESLGLPDLTSFNENLMTKLTERMESGKFDPESFFKSMNPASNPFGKMFMDAAMKNMNMMNKKPSSKKTGENEKKDS
ncbi:MAG: DUF6489 family protein [Thermodesulfobacteriota bacterium]